MMFKTAFGQYLATLWTKSLTIPALILNKSSLVIPGFCGIPAGMITKSHPVKASSIGRSHEAFHFSDGEMRRSRPPVTIGEISSVHGVTRDASV